MIKFISRFSILIAGLLFIFVSINYGNESNAPIFFIVGLILALVGLLVASRSSILGYGDDMKVINGIGTTVYGKSDFNQADNSYIATKYFTFFFLPIIPIASYRVKEKGLVKKFLGTSVKLEMTEIPLELSQVIKTYFLTWGILIILILIYILLIY
jgi:hypothetical protein